MIYPSAMVTAVFWKGSLDVLLHTCIIIVTSANICVNKCFGVVHFLTGSIP